MTSSRPDILVDEFAKRCGYRFRDAGLLHTALTHRSYANERKESLLADNERLEFLGDSVLGLAISTLLWERFPDAPEGELTRRRADIVCAAGLSRVAERIKLGELLRLGRGEEASGGRTKPRLLASAFEACLAALYLDGGFDAARDVVRELFGDEITAALPGQGDFKSRLQERVQSVCGRTPVYQLVQTQGAEHDRTFRVAVRVDDAVLGEGDGRSKIEAEQSAARIAWERLERDELKLDAQSRDRTKGVAHV